ncbi:MAG: cell division protein FtsZ [Candidatus Ratteibacteria bacterium]|nr:cell division protein FtsZ [Candidatus Ratteibacteria bacterium]
MLEFDDPEYRRFAKIKVLGIGGGGSNAVNRMINSGMKGIEFFTLNTDAQALANSNAVHKIQIGSKLTKGLGSGANPEIGHQAALEDRKMVREALRDTDMVFLTAGLGGGTGTGATPILAEIAKELNILTIAVVTKPFLFEGRKRSLVADNGLNELRNKVDTLICIPNQKLFNVVDKGTSILDAFKVADDVLARGVEGISDLVIESGLINLDFADLKTAMSEGGKSLLGVGYGRGKGRALNAANAAISSPLLEYPGIEGAKGVLINITGGKDLTLFEVNEASSVIYESADRQANIIFGAIVKPKLSEEVKVTIIATGMDEVKPERLSRLHSSRKGQPNFDSPAYKRGRRERSSLNKDSDIIDESDLDIPTFLRNKAPRH